MVNNVLVGWSWEENWIKKLDVHDIIISESVADILCVKIVCCWFRLIQIDVTSYLLTQIYGLNWLIGWNIATLLL